MVATVVSRDSGSGPLPSRSMAVIGPPAGAIGLGWEPASWGFEGSCGPFLLTRDGLS